MDLTWRLDDGRAGLSTPFGELWTNVDQPAEGFQLGAAAACMQVCLPTTAGRSPRVNDCYVRANDLVVTYAEDDDRAVRSQVYWRAWQDSPDCFSLSMIFSVQTSRLDSQPQTQLVSWAPAGEWLRSLAADGSFESVDASRSYEASDAADFFVFRPGDQSHSWATMIHPSDFAGGQLEIEPNESCLRLRLFPDSLEKGVIRRARVTSMWMPRRDDLARATRSRTTALGEAPPLTT